MLQRKQKIFTIPFFFKTNNSKFEYPLNGLYQTQLNIKYFNYLLI